MDHYKLFYFIWQSVYANFYPYISTYSTYSQTLYAPKPIRLFIDIFISNQSVSGKNTTAFFIPAARVQQNLIPFLHVFLRLHHFEECFPRTGEKLRI